MCNTSLPRYRESRFVLPSEIKESTEWKRFLNFYDSGASRTPRDERYMRNAITRNSLREYQTVNIRAIMIEVLIRKVAIREPRKSAVYCVFRVST